jgi:D-alanyl-D-alanine dipeptidase
VAQPVAAESRPPAFVDAATVVPGLVVEMRYAGTYNFVGTRIDGYEAPVCLLTKPAAEALAKVQLALASSGVGLKVFDCYRPTRAVAHFVRWARDLRDIRMKGEFYPNVEKGTLFRDGYIASRSGHSRGSTVDLTLVEILPGPDGKLRERDMGTPYDFFSPLSWPRSSKMSDTVRANRELLAGAMRKGGFLPYDKEWWHFTLANEPFPDRYFDFPVR